MECNYHTNLGTVCGILRYHFVLIEFFILTTLFCFNNQLTLGEDENISVYILIIP